MADDNKWYVAMTIGPLGDTMSLVTKPAALWLSSYLFSWLARELCVALVQGIDGLDAIVKPEDIVSPYYPVNGDDALYNHNDGVGLFSDHIIYHDRLGTFGQLPDLINAVKARAAQTFGIGADFTWRYLMVKYCRFEVGAGENPILKCSHMLDNLELDKQFIPTQDGNPLLAVMTNQNVARLGKDVLKIDGEAWQLVKQRGDKFTLRDLPDIAHIPHCEDMKKNRYYCMLRADGDNMSKIIASLKTDEDCRAFSLKCLQYCQDVAKKVGDYGGTTIYSGGDDLFAVVPCEGIIDGQRSGTVFDLIREIEKLFDAHFKVYIDNPQINPKPTLSFGLFIGFHKYPLFEAVARSAELLFDIAKQTKNKACTALMLQKHSGQVTKLLIRSAQMAEFCRLLNDAIEADRQTGEEHDKVLLSASQKLELFHLLFNAVGRDAASQNLNERSKISLRQTFINIFDADFHVKGSSQSYLHDVLPGFYDTLCRTGGLWCFDKSGATREEYALALSGVLRICRFFVEKASEQEKSEDPKGAN